MPVNFLELRAKIKQMGGEITQQQQKRVNLLEKTEEILRLYADKNSLLQARVEAALKANPKLRCAVPTQEPLDLAIDCPQDETPAVLIAADGSQINPSRHDSIPFCVINVGVLIMDHGKQASPQEYTKTDLLYHDDVITPQGLLTEGYVALRRDLSERQVLANIASGYSFPVITLTDGPLELFREPRESAAFREVLRSYIESLQRLEEMKVATAGYVDKPFGDLFIRLLELVLIPEDEFDQTGKKRPLLGIRDEEIFKTLLEPGQRSAVFSIQSQSSSQFKGGLKLHFFYLNIGRENHPAVARIEIPAWVVHNKELMDMLHASLVAQSKKMGANPYPYILHRAHEIALVSFDEKKKIENMINAEYINHGVPWGAQSAKQANKDLDTKRTRYK